MNWPRASIMVDRFERMAQTNVRELKQHYQRILQLENEYDYENATVEKNNAKRLVDQILAGFHQILTLRAELLPEAQEQFDVRLEPIRLQIQSTVNALNTLISKPSTKNLPEHSQNNMFADCFDNEPTTSIYEEELSKRSIQKNVQVEDMRLRAEQARLDAEATKKLSDDIEDLNHIMADLARLVHEQHDMVDSIEEHVERAQRDVQTGHRQLKKAVASNSAKYPVIAAVAGSVALGGPVGLGFGSAIAGIAAAVGGAVAGLYGGRVLKKQVVKEATAESAN
uniref:t-SNARE coiled-coil homology domain-containing protein n=1 Tax=Acrobeloides nanus TaxID=290746 RepID=A0A914BY20_9BILA